MDLLYMNLQHPSQKTKLLSSEFRDNAHDPRGTIIYDAS